MAASKKNIPLADYLFQVVENSDFLTGFIVGHLVLESLLKAEISRADSNVGRFSNRLVFASVVDLCQEMNIIKSDQAGTLRAINKMRNNLAHNLRYEPTRNEVKDLFIKAKSTFSDMTDGLDQGIETLSNPAWKHEPGDYTLADLFIQIAYDLNLFHDTEIQKIGK